MIAMTETWITSDKLYSTNFSNKFIIESALASKSVGPGQPSGGLCLLIEREYCKIIQVKKSRNYILFLIVITKNKLLNKNNKTMMIMLTYVPPGDLNTLNEIFKVIDIWYYITPYIIILGDFNSRIGEVMDSKYKGPNHLIYNSRKSKDKQVNNLGKKLLDFITENKLFILNGHIKPDFPAEYTCLTHLGKSTIDLTICSKLLDYCTNFMATLMDASDHFPTITKFRLSSAKGTNNQYNNRPKIKYKISKYWREIDNRFIAIPVITSTNNEKIYNLITTILNDYICVNKNKRNIQSKAKEGWFDSDCYKMRMTKQAEFKKFRQNSTVLNFNSYKKAKQTYNNILKTKKSNYFCKIELNLIKNNNDGKVFWNTIRRFWPKSNLNINFVIIDFNTWKQFYNRFSQTHTEILLNTRIEVYNDILDSDFIITELDDVIKK
ncbi:uncharacterized protein LOC111622745 [Centruroides sculpturatus]|uniref:uncharacterized protein LOC111622745 n=1 Tax=Centruroides sculpturatus TaxID=218467 RepID=UPI000C6CE520|nr:uncharacterized protein LOC111622745 [Centruroides sculpturatus]